MRFQRCYNGVRLLDGLGPSDRNIMKIDAGAMPMMHRMMNTGLNTDLDHFARLGVELGQDLERITSDIHRKTGYWINPGSGDQVADLLFKKLKIKQVKVKMTPSGDRESVADEILTAIQHEHDVVPSLQEYKEVEKLKGTYVDPMPILAVRVAFGRWKMFPNLGHTRVPAGRLNCKEPNLLAIPTRTKRGTEVRKGFPARNGYKIVSVDESQIEPRVAGHRSKDQALINVYLNKEDLYSDFATAGFRLPDRRFRNSAGVWEYPGVDKMAHRRPSKICVLAAIYDVTAIGLQAQMPVICANCGKEALEHTCGQFTTLWTEKKCQGLLDSFYKKYPGLAQMRARDHAYMRRNAYIIDMWGRKCHEQAVRSVLEWVVTGALREGSNFPMQSGAQGTIKLAMAAVDDDFERHKLWRDDLVNIWLQIHDELLFEVRDDLVQYVEQSVEYRFRTCVRLDVPLEAGSANAISWGHLKK